MGNIKMKCLNVTEIGFKCQTCTHGVYFAKTEKHNRCIITSAIVEFEEFCLPRYKFIEKEQNWFEHFIFGDELIVEKLEDVCGTIIYLSDGRSLYVEDSVDYIKGVIEN
jgi:hypothetical protein